MTLKKSLLRRVNQQTAKKKYDVSNRPTSPETETLDSVAEKRGFQLAGLLSQGGVRGNQTEEIWTKHEDRVDMVLGLNFYYHFLYMLPFFSEPTWFEIILLCV